MNNLKEEFYQILSTQKDIFDFIQQFALDGFWFWDLKSENVWSNPKMLDTLGYQNIDGAADHLSLIVDKEEVNKILDSVSSLNEKLDADGKISLTLFHENGTIVPVVCHVRVVWSAESEESRLLCCVCKEVDTSESEQENESKLYQTVLNSEAIYVTRINYEGNYTYVNEYFCKAFGLKKEELLGASSLVSIIEEDHPKCFEVGRACFEKPGEPQKITLHKIDKLGRIKASEWEFTGMQNEQGIVFEILCVGYDVTRKIKMERDFAALLSNMTDVLFIINPLGVFTYVSPSWTKTYGYGVNETVGRSFTEFVHPDDIERCFAALTATHAHGVPTPPVEHRIRHKNGEWFWSNTRASVDQTNAELILTSHDITQRRLDEEKLKELALVASNTTDFIMTSDAEGLITWANLAFQKRSGYSLDELVGKKPSMLIQGPETSEVTRTILREGVKSHRSMHEVILNYTKTGEKYWIDLNINPIFDDFGKCTHFIAVMRDITASMQSREELIHTKILLEETSKVARIGGWEYFVELRKLNWSTLTKEIHGLGDDFTPDFEKVDQFYKNPASREKLKISVGECITFGKPINIDIEITTLDGREIWVRILGKAEFENGKCFRIVGTMQDIDDLKRAEENSLKNAELLRKLSQRVPGTLYQFQVFDDGRIMFPYVSKDLADSFDFFLQNQVSDRESLVQRIHPEDREMFISSINRSRETLEKWDLDYRIYTPDSGTIWVRGESIPERLDDSVLWHGYLQDITARKQVQQEILKSEIKYRTLYNSTSDAVMLVDHNGFFDCNAAALKMFEVESYDTFLRLNILDVSPVLQSDGQKSSDLLQNYSELAYANGSYRFEWEYKRRRSGEVFPVEILFNVIELSGTKILQAVVRDITERKRAETEILVARQQAEAGSRSKSEFLTNMSHEIRTPLNGVIGFTDLLMKTSLDATQHQYVSMVFQSANSLLDIINDILDFSKIEAGKLELSLEKADLLEICAQVTDMITYQAHQKNLEVLLNIPSDVPRFVCVDAVRLRQVLINLLGNAVKFTEQGEIELRIDVLDGLAGQNTVFRFSVRDTGIGINPQNLRKIFEAFSQEDASTTKRFGGTGLGLAISNKLLALMHSELQLSSSLGQGSTFFFDVSFQSYEDESPDWSDIESVKRVLIADSNRANARILQEMLSNRNIDSEIVYSGEDVVGKINTGVTYDVLLIDYFLPDIDGITVVRQIQEATEFTGHESSVILLSKSSNDESLNLLAQEVGIDYVLTKPVKIQQLFNALCKLDGHTAQVLVPVEEDLPTTTGKGDNELTILVAEDNNINMILVKAFLNKLLVNVRLVEAKNGIEAVQLYQQENPDMILMDVQMPEMNGYEATMQIRKLENGTRIPIIALTAGILKGERERCVEAGMDDYLTKPILKDVLQATLDQWLVK